MRAYWYWPFLRDEELGLAASFAARGHDLTVHTIAGRVADDPSRSFVVSADVADVATRSEGTMRWIASRGTTYPSRARNRARTVRNGQYDIAHVIYLNYFTDGAALRRLSRHVPVVATVHDVVPHQGRVPRIIERQLLALQYSAIDHVVVHHPTVGERLRAEFDVPTERIHYVPWAVPIVDATVRDVPGPTPTVLMFGTLRRNKGIDVLLEAMRAMPEADLRLVIAGRGFADVEAAVTAAAAQDARIDARIGFVTEAEKTALYRSSDLVVLPYTTFSSQSAVLHDAYAHGCPVVVSDVGALGPAVREDHSGWVVPPNAPEALARALTSAFSDVEAWKGAATAAAAVAQDRSPDRVAGLLEDLYRTVISTRQ